MYISSTPSFEGLLPSHGHAGRTRAPAASPGRHQRRPATSASPVRSWRLAPQLLGGASPSTPGPAATARPWAAGSGGASSYVPQPAPATARASSPAHLTYRASDSGAHQHLSVLAQRGKNARPSTNTGGETERGWSPATKGEPFNPLWTSKHGSITGRVPQDENRLRPGRSSSRSDLTECDVPGVPRRLLLPEKDPSVPRVRDRRGSAGALRDCTNILGSMQPGTGRLSQVDLKPAQTHARARAKEAEGLQPATPPPPPPGATVNNGSAGGVTSAQPPVAAVVAIGRRKYSDQDDAVAMPAAYSLGPATLEQEAQAESFVAASGRGADGRARKLSDGRVQSGSPPTCRPGLSRGNIASSASTSRGMKGQSGDTPAVQGHSRTSRSGTEVWIDDPILELGLGQPTKASPSKVKGLPPPRTVRARGATGTHSTRTSTDAAADPNDQGSWTPEVKSNGRGRQGTTTAPASFQPHEQRRSQAAQPITPQPSMGSEIRRRISEPVRGPVQWVEAVSVGSTSPPSPAAILPAPALVKPATGGSSSMTTPTPQPAPSNAGPSKALPGPAVDMAPVPALTSPAPAPMTPAPARAHRLDFGPASTESPGWGKDAAAAAAAAATAAAAAAAVAAAKVSGPTLGTAVAAGPSESSPGLQEQAPSMTRARTEVMEEARTGGVAGSAPPSGRPGKPPGRPPPSRSCSRGPSGAVPAGGESGRGPSPSPGPGGPFSRRLHLKQSYQTPAFTTVFGKEDVSLDLGLLQALFAGHEQRSTASQERVSSVRRGEGVSVLDFRKAMGLEIALSKVSATPEGLRDCLLGLDFGCRGVGLEDIERLLGKLPSAEEAQLLLKHAGSPEKLRELERRLLPLCAVPDAERRLRLLHIGMSHSSIFSQLAESFECMYRAASEVLGSARLHNVLRCSLQIANYINHGSLDGAKTFSVASFSAFASFKLGSSSALHYLCLTLCNAEFVREMKADLKAVFRAARESSEAQQEELRRFSTFTTDAEDHLETEVGEEARERISGLLQVLSSEQNSLQQAEKRARSRVQEAQRFLGERAAVLLKSEAFFSHIVGLVRHIEDALADLSQNPQKWHDLPSAAPVVQPL